MLLHLNMCELNMSIQFLSTLGRFLSRVRGRPGLGLLDFLLYETLLFFFFFLFLLYCLRHTQPISVEISTVSLLRPCSGRGTVPNQDEAEERFETGAAAEISALLKNCFSTTVRRRESFHSHFSLLTGDSNQQPPLDPHWFLLLLLHIHSETRKIYRFSKG